MNDRTAVAAARVRGRVSAEQWAAREDLAACYRLAAFDLMYAQSDFLSPAPWR